MAENWIFGSNINLPSVPGLPSTCEAELLHLMKEVDLAVERKSEKWMEETKKKALQCTLKTQEIDRLKDMIRTKHKECLDLQQLCEANDLKHKQQDDHFLKEIEHLKDENARLQKSIMLLQKDSETKDEFQNENLKEVTKNLMEEIKTLKQQIQLKDQTVSLLEDSYQKLLNFITSSQSVENVTKNNKEKMDYLRTDILNEIVSKFSRSFATEEDECQRVLQNIISQEILSLQTQLKAILE